LTPIDFFLFGYIKGKVSDHNWERREDFLSAITEIRTKIDQEVLLSVFSSWVNRLKWVIKQGEKYYKRQSKTRDTFSRLVEQT
jgi:hypothetical protein